MTLILHLIHEDYQIVAADGKLNGGAGEDKFRKVILYPNGFLYYMGEIGWSGNGTMHDWVTGELPLTSEITIVHFRNMVEAVVAKMKVPFARFPDCAFGFGGWIEGQCVSILIAFENGQKHEVNLGGAFLSKPLLESCYNEAYRRTYGERGNRLVPSTFDDSDLKLLDHFFADATGCVGASADFNSSLNVAVVRASGCKWLREENKITVIA